MEANFRWAALTAIAPVAWGANYFVTRQFLPPGLPLYGAAIRALPAGLMLLAVCRTRPSGSWWWRSALLGTLNVAAFFVLVYLAAQLLPTSTASTLMATSPVAISLLAWVLLSERPLPVHMAGAVIGIGGVFLMLLTAAGHTSVPGVLASAAAMSMSSLGYVLAKKWNARADVLASTAWQLVAGGLLLLPFAVALEGPPPALRAPAILGFGYVTTMATALAFAAWFAGLRHLPAATVGLIGLLNPVTGVLLGTTIAGKTLTSRQLCGLVLTCTGIILGQRHPARRTAPAARPRMNRVPCALGPSCRPGKRSRHGATSGPSPAARSRPSSWIRSWRQAGGPRPRRTGSRGISSSSPIVSSFASWPRSGGAQAMSPGRRPRSP